MLGRTGEWRGGWKRKGNSKNRKKIMEKKNSKKLKKNYPYPSKTKVDFFGKKRCVLGLGQTRRIHDFSMEYFGNMVDPENLIWEVKQHRAWLELAWVTGAIRALLGPLRTITFSIIFL